MKRHLGSLNTDDRDGMDWVRVVQNMSQWRGILITVRSLPEPQKSGKFSPYDYQLLKRD
jgi:hypothetical protein